MEFLETKELDKKFFSLIKENRPDLFLEVGAYEASASNNVKTSIPECRVVAFEANPYNYKRFKGSHSANIEYTHLAISNYTGQTTFYIQASNNGKTRPQSKANDSILERTEPNVKYENVNVNVDTLDNLFGEEYTNIAMWIDVEGVAYEALLGARSLLERTKFLKIEVESKQFWKDQVTDEKIIEFLESIGFTYSYKDQEYPEQYNIIFIRE